MQSLYEQELPPKGITSGYINGVLHRIEDSIEAAEEVGLHIQ